MKRYFKTLVTKEWSQDDKVLFMCIGVLTGIIIGFCIAPIKSGILMFSGNGCNNSGNKSVASVSKTNRQEKKEKGTEAEE